ncbi:MAG: hypothetical protein ACRDIB_20820 [Ardenticatenaceae bacterium]
MSPSIVVSLVWSLFLLFLFLRVAYSRVGAPDRARGALFIILAVALLARLVPNFLLPVGAGYDIESYRIVSDLLLQGEDVYGSEATLQRHPYLPMQM